MESVGKFYLDEIMRRGIFQILDRIRLLAKNSKRANAHDHGKEGMQWGEGRCTYGNKGEAVSQRATQRQTLLLVRQKISFCRKNGGVIVGGRTK